MKTLILSLILLTSCIPCDKRNLTKPVSQENPFEEVEKWINEHKKPIKIISDQCAVGRRTYTFISADGSIHIFANGVCYRDVVFPEKIE
jgi:hypothetical protein